MLGMRIAGGAPIIALEPQENVRILQVMEKAPKAPVTISPVAPKRPELTSTEAVVPRFQSLEELVEGYDREAARAVLGSWLD